jgi:hypothetical protein
VAAVAAAAVAASARAAEAAMARAAEAAKAATAARVKAAQRLMIGSSRTCEMHSTKRFGTVHPFCTLFEYDCTDFEYIVTLQVA